MWDAFLRGMLRLVSSKVCIFVWDPKAQQQQSNIGMLLCVGNSCVPPWQVWQFQVIEGCKLFSMTDVGAQTLEWWGRFTLCWQKAGKVLMCGQTVVVCPKAPEGWTQALFVCAALCRKFSGSDPAATFATIKQVLMPSEVLQAPL